MGTMAASTRPRVQACERIGHASGGESRSASDAPGTLNGGGFGEGARGAKVVYRMATIVASAVEGPLDFGDRLQSLAVVKSPHQSH